MHILSLSRPHQVVCMGIPSTFIITLFFSTRHVGDLRQGFLGEGAEGSMSGVARWGVGGVSMSRVAR